MNLNQSFNPSISIIIPSYNEEKIIKYKLKNIYKLVYPREKFEILLTDDASTDNTVTIASEFAKNNPELNLCIIRSKVRKGKSYALNEALKRAKHNILVMTDADAFLDSNILIKALPYLSDPSIGAIISRQKVLSPSSFITKSEDYYLDISFGTLKLGQSKIHSTLIFHGSFAAYNRKFLSQFNIESDDSGTALDIIQQGARTIYVPEAIAYDIPPTSYKRRFLIKVRRATHNLKVYKRCIKLLFKKRLSIPKKIIIPEIIIYIFTPLVFTTLLVYTFILTLIHPLFLIAVLSLAALPILWKKLRISFYEIIQGNIALTLALVSTFIKGDLVTWGTKRGLEFSDIEQKLQDSGLI